MLLTLLRGLRQVTPGIVWRGAPWSAIQVGSCSSAKFRPCTWTIMRFPARAPHYRRAERLLRRRSGGNGASPLSSAASGLTPFPMSSTMLLDLDCTRWSEVNPCNQTTMRSTAWTPSVTYTFGRYGVSPVSSAASGLTPFPTCSPMSLELDCTGYSNDYVCATLSSRGTSVT